ncbi:MAG: type I DNA topoisomerase [Cyclobacteriaceae bacterium]|nr:type I DNA topoisomerase [Cyclobacteriaceae bacterium]
MAKNLVIVESPAKAKTIEGYLGKEYKVVSSYGHVRDLPKDDMAIDVKNGFKPTYEISKDKKELIKTLKGEVKLAEMVYLASDDDREGEAISWHLKEALNLDDSVTRRIVFHEITKNAILNAIKSPRGIDLDLVNAQQARRILDRLVGFEISPILWKKIQRGLSAGRVQSVAVRLVVEREREIESFNSKSFFKVSALFTLDKSKTLKAELGKKFDTSAEANEFLKKCVGALFTISNLEKKPVKKSPAPPFTTSTLQQEASRKLSFSVSQTMTVAQKLYESGKITYMRTDSVNLSQEAINAAASAIESMFGKEYVKTRQFKTANKSAQEAHEAIRPSNMLAQEVSSNRNEQRLYELIWKRTLASQMAEALLERTIATVSISTTPETLTAQGEVITFDGFLKLYIESTDDDDQNGEAQGVLPPLTVGQKLALNQMIAREGFSRPSARYNEASLVKKLEEMGIGRPSTYAPTITTIQKREYVIKETREGQERQYKELILQNDQIKSMTRTEVIGAEKNKLFPTNTAMIVNDFLVGQFPKVIDYSFTAQVEKELDEIAGGNLVWEKMIGGFYSEFHSDVETSANVSKADIGSVRLIGTDPATGKNVYARLARFGPCVQLGDVVEGEEKPRYSSLRKGQLIESVSLAEAMELFKLPRIVGTFENLPIEANTGRFGPYVKHNSKFISLGKEDDPLTVTEQKAIELIESKRKTDESRTIKTFEENSDFQILQGKWGPYLKAGAKNVKIPKGKKPEDLTYQECAELAKGAPEKKKGKGKARAK